MADALVSVIEPVRELRVTRPERMSGSTFAKLRRACLGCGMVAMNDGSGAGAGWTGSSDATARLVEVLILDGVRHTVSESAARQILKESAIEVLESEARRGPVADAEAIALSVLTQVTEAYQKGMGASLYDLPALCRLWVQSVTMGGLTSAQWRDVMRRTAKYAKKFVGDPAAKKIEVG